MKEHKTAEQSKQMMDMSWYVFLGAMFVGGFLFVGGMTLNGLISFCAAAMFGLLAILIQIKVQGQRTRDFIAKINNIDYYPEHCDCDKCKK